LTPDFEFLTPVRGTEYYDPVRGRVNSEAEAGESIRRNPYRLLRISLFPSLTAVLSAALVTGTCAVVGYRDFTKDLKFDAMKSPRVGIVVVAFAPGLERQEAERMLAGFSEALQEHLQAQGYEPRLLLAQLCEEGLKDAATVGGLMGPGVFEEAREQDVAALWAFRVVGLHLKPREVTETAVYEGTATVLAGRCWLDWYSLDGALAGSRETVAPDYEKNETHTYQVLPPEEYGARLARDVVRLHVKSYRGST
jgi:hypothetical protein